MMSGQCMAGAGSVNPTAWTHRLLPAPADCCSGRLGSRGSGTDSGSDLVSAPTPRGRYGNAGAAAGACRLTRIAHHGFGGEAASVRSGVRRPYAIGGAC